MLARASAIVHQSQAGATFKLRNLRRSEVVGVNKQRAPTRASHVSKPRKRLPHEAVALELVGSPVGVAPNRDSAACERHSHRTGTTDMPEPVPRRSVRYHDDAALPPIVSGATEGRGRHGPTLTRAQPDAPEAAAATDTLLDVRMATPQRELKILVTAVGGDLGQAVIKALRLGPANWQIHGVDIEPGSYASAFVDGYHVVPPATDGAYFSTLDSLTSKEGIDVVIPASEAEIAALDAVPLPHGAIVIGHPRQWLDVYLDKLRTMRSLSGKVALADFGDGTSPGQIEELIDRVGFPLVVKPRRSSGSRGVLVTRNQSELAAALESTSDPLVQQFVDDADGEYSAAVFRTDDFESVIVLRRTLRGSTGPSWTAEVVEAPELADYALEIARHAGARGSINIQVRATTSGPRLLEINPRFSSLAAARAAAGFRDVEWAVAEALGMEIARPARRFRALRFRRFYHEVIDIGGGFGAIPAWSPAILNVPGEGIAD
jgi:carbamoyl-phosphate synthase large subunit